MFDDIMEWVFGLGIFAMFITPLVMVIFLICKEVHCWNLEGDVIPIECQIPNK